MRRWLRYTYLRLIRQQDTPHNIAMGMAIGIFFGLCIPVIQILFALLVATFFRVNRLAAFLGTWISNPITFPFLIPFYFVLGQYLTGIETIKSVKIVTYEEQKYLQITPWQIRKKEPKQNSSVVPLTPEIEVWNRESKHKSYLVALHPVDLGYFLWRKGMDLVLIWFAAAIPCSIIGSILGYQITFWMIHAYRNRKQVREQLIKKMKEKLRGQ